MQRVRDLAPGIVCIAITLSLALFHAWTDAQARRKPPLASPVSQQRVGATGHAHFAPLNNWAMLTATIPSVSAEDTAQIAERTH